MDLKCQNRLARIEQIKTLIKQNPNLTDKEIVLKAGITFGFSKRLTLEYLQLIKFEDKKNGL